MRLFVSVDLPDDLAPAVASIQDDLRDASGLNVTDPEQAHLTLKFLGEVEEGRLDEVTDAIAAAVEAAGVEPFEAAVGGLGAFPSEDYIRVVWTGVEDDGQLRRLHEELEERTVALGVDPEEHDFTPHVTLARMEHAGGKELVQEALGTDPTVGTMRVEEVRLKESVLRSAGPEYSTVERFPL